MTVHRWLGASGPLYTLLKNNNCTYRKTGVYGENIPCIPIKFYPHLTPTLSHWFSTQSNNSSAIALSFLYALRALLCFFIPANVLSA